MGRRVQSEGRTAVVSALRLKQRIPDESFREGQKDSFNPLSSCTQRAVH